LNCLYIKAENGFSQPKKYRLTVSQIGDVFGFEGESIELNFLTAPEGYESPECVIEAEKDEYFVGDVVVFQDGYSLVVHRIISIDGEIVVTQGDANNVADSPIKITDIKGKVVMSIPFVGCIVSAIKSPVGIFCILGTAVALLVLSYRKEKDEETNKINKLKEEIRKLKENN
jgi:hypothetical protein